MIHVPTCGQAMCGIELVGCKASYNILRTSHEEAYDVHDKDMYTYKKMQGWGFVELLVLLL